jgi:hypothetical protein
MIISRKIRRIGGVARMGGMKISIKFFSERLKERDHLGGLGIGGRIL